MGWPLGSPHLHDIGAKNPQILGRGVCEEEGQGHFSKSYVAQLSSQVIEPCDLVLF
jgi:hypothetical protein